jgi:hypothetical protein
MPGTLAQGGRQRRRDARWTWAATSASLSVEFLLEELDGRARCWAERLTCEMRMRWRSAGDHLHELAASQYQGLQPLQLGVGQRLDEALALGVLVQHAGERRQHPRVQRCRSWPAHPSRGRSHAPCAG